MHGLEIPCRVTARERHSRDQVMEHELVEHDDARLVTVKRQFESFPVVRRDRDGEWGRGVPAAGRELSFYVTEAAHQPDTAKRLRRHSLRIDGFVSVYAKLTGGELITRPVVFKGHELVLNVSTSAAGSIRVELQDEGGQPIDKYALGNCPEIYGDDIERVVNWDNGPDVSALAGRQVRIRMVLKDADIYSFQFR